MSVNPRLNSFPVRNRAPWVNSLRERHDQRRSLRKSRGGGNRGLRGLAAGCKNEVKVRHTNTFGILSREDSVSLPAAVDRRFDTERAGLADETLRAK